MLVEQKRRAKGISFIVAGERSLSFGVMAINGDQYEP